MEQEAQRGNPLGSEPIGRLVVQFAVPSVISMVVNAVYNLVDQVFIGRGVNYLGNGATNVVFPLVVIAMAFSFMIADGSTAYISLNLGRGETEKARRAVGAAVALQATAGIVIMILLQIFMEPALRLFGATDEVLPLALSYGRIIVAGFPCFMVGIGLNGIIRADGSPRYAMAAMLAGAILNMILDPIAIFVLGWSVAGAAAATITGQTVVCVLGLLYLKRLKTIPKFELTCLRVKWQTARSVCTLGVSSFISQVAGAFVIFITNNALVTYGAQSIYGENIPLSAFGIVVKVNQICVAVLTGLAIGSQPIIGFNYGAEQYRRVRQTYWTEVAVATAAACIGWCAFQFAPEYIVWLFENEDKLYNEFAVQCFRIFLLLLPILGFQLGSGIFFQAIGRPVIATFLALSRQILFLTPAVLILSSSIGVTGILWAGPVADLCASTLSAGFVGWQMVTLHRLIHQKDTRLT